MTAINEETVKLSRGAILLLMALVKMSPEEQDAFDDALTDLAMSEAVEREAG